MKKKLYIRSVSSDTPGFALTSNNTVRLYSTQDTCIYGCVGSDSTIFTDVVVDIPKGYLGVIYASQNLTDNSVQMLGGVKVIEPSDGATNIKIKVKSDVNVVIPKFTHIATLTLLKHKKIAI